MATTNGTVIPSGEINIHIVDVGMNDSMLYAPNDIKAAPGDIVSFRFWNNHSVVESQYGFPCVPNNDLTGRPIFYSGFYKELNATELLHPPTWNLTVNDTSPVYFYCSVPGSCINYGMVGAINPRGPGDVANQIAWAKEADFMVPPGQPLPSGSLSSLIAITGVQPTGVPQNNSSSSQTFSSTPTSTPSATSSPTSQSSASSSSPTLSAGVIAGIVIGVLALILISIGIWFAMRRTKRLLVALEGNQREPEEPKPPVTYDEAMRGEPSYRSHDSVTMGYPGWQSPMHPHDKPTPTVWSSPSINTEAFSDHRPERQRSELFGDTTAPRVHEMYVAPGRDTIE